MSTIDEDVVNMKFDNSNFLRGVKSTLDGLGTLVRALKLDGAAKGVSSSFGSINKAMNLDQAKKGLDQIPASINKINDAGRRFSLATMATGAEGMIKKFGALQVAGVAALATIVSKAVSSGLQFAKSFTTAPITDGLHEYETTLGSIQTILANTGLKGQKGIDKVNASLNELNKYSDKTIYNFTQMASNIGTFTAAGVDLKTSTAAIKGIANLAAVSGSTSEQASTAMYQLSQALASGTVKLQDWNSVVNAGMGGKVFQKALEETARVHGVKIDEMIKKQKGFRNTLQKGWLTSDILTETLNKFTGDVSEAQLKKMGYTEKQIKGIVEMGKVAQNAATKVKTFTQLVDTLKEAAGSGWTTTWQTILGDFGQAPKLFTSINNVLGGFITKSANTRNAVLKDWAKLGGRTTLIKGIGDAFKDIGAVLKPIKDAFREIFPAKTGKDLAIMTRHFAEIAAKMKIGKDTADKLKRTFAGVFAIFSILAKVVKGAVGFFGDLFGAMAPGAKSLLGITAGWGDWLVHLNKMLEKSGAVKKFFDGILDKIGQLKPKLAPVVKFFEGVRDAIGNLFSKFHIGDVSKVTDAMDKVKGRFDWVKTIGKVVGKAFSAIGKLFGNLGPVIGRAMSNIGTWIGNAFSNIDYSKALDTINTGLLAGVALIIKKFLSGGIKVDVGGGLLSKIKDAFGGVTDTLQTMQSNLKADTLLKIAGAVAVLTAAIVVISLIDSSALTKSLLAIGGGLATLFVTMKTLTSTLSIKDTAKLTALSVSMTAIATAMVLLAGAIKIMSAIPAEDISKALIGIAGGLGVIAAAMRLMPKGMIGQATAIGILAVSLSLLAGAVELFAHISWGDMGHGLLSIGGGLAVIAGAMHLMPKGMIGQAAAIGILALSLSALAGAITLFSLISWGDMLHGMVGVAGALVIIAGAMQLMPKDMVLQAVALVAISGAITVLGLAISAMGNNSWEEILKGLVTLAGGLGILAAALIVMNGTLAGSAALVVASAALMLFVPVLTALGLLPWSVIITGLVALAGIFTVLGLAGLVLAPLTPVILGLSAAVLLIGAGLALAGLGALAFATAFGIVVAAGAAGVAVLGNILKTFIDAIPGALRAFGEGIVQLAGAIAKGGPQFFAAFTTIIKSILKAIVTNAPGVARAFKTMVITALDTIVSLTPKIVRAGLNLIIGFLKAIRDKIGDIVTIVAQIIVNFLNALSSALPTIIAAGVSLIINFLNGIATAIRDQGPALVAAAGNIAKAIIDGLVNGLKNGVGAVVDAAKGVAQGALHSAMHFLGIHSPSKEFEKVGKFVNQGFAKGLKGGSRDGVLAAYQTTADLLKTAYDNAVDDAKRAQTKLAAAQKGKKVHVKAVKNSKGKTIKKAYTTTVHDPKAIAQAKKDLAQAKSEEARTKAAHHTLMTQLDDEEKKLAKLADQYTAVGDKLKAAQQKLDDAKKVRDDYNKSIKDQYSALPDIATDTTVDQFRANLQKEIIQTKQFMTVLAALRKMGLNDDLYKELLAKGTDALPFAQNLLAGGSVAVKDLNNLDKTLNKEAADLGKTASTQLYQVGVNVAQGLVDGLKKQQAAIQKQMNIIADAMVAQIKKKLGIKSPSREFAKVGNWTVQGLAQGLEASSAISEKAATNVGTNTLEAMRAAVANATGLASGLDMRPTISPVLDLTDVQNNAKKLAGLLPDAKLQVSSAYSSATRAASGVARNLNAQGQDVGAGDQTVVFNQYNNSPKALSAGEIYRQTRSQLSVAKGAMPRA